MSTTYISATHPNTGRRHTVDFPGYLAEYIAPDLAELGFTDIRRTDSDGTVSLVKRPPVRWVSLIMAQVLRDQQDKDRVEGAIRDAQRDYRQHRITAGRLSLLLHLGSQQPWVAWQGAITV